MKGISATETTKEGLKINSVFMMADSGARGSAAPNETIGWNERFNC